MFEGVSDPLLANQVTASFYEAEQLHSNTEEWNGNCDMGSVFDWTPPASPIPTMDNDTFVKHEPYLNDLGMSFGDELAEQDATEQLEGEHASAKSGSKRKASSPVSEFERKKLKQKAETERMQRTEACEKAVAELASKNDEDPESRRHTHNVLERKRRHDLKNSYQLLRECLPSLEENERAPTGQILLHAVEYIASLDQGGTDLSALVAKAKLENLLLKRKTETQEQTITRQASELTLLRARKDELEKERREYSENLLDQLLKKKDRSRSRPALLKGEKKEKKEKKSDSAASVQSSVVVPP